MNTNQNKNLEEQSEEDGLMADIELQTNKLLILIKNLTMPEEVKESLVDLLAAFSLPQIEKLTNILEAKYLDEQTKEIDEKFKKEIESLVADFNLQAKKDEETFLNHIDVITKTI